MLVHSILEYDREWPRPWLVYLASKDAIPASPIPAIPRPRDEHDRDLIDLWLLGHPVA